MKTYNTVKKNGSYVLAAAATSLAVSSTASAALPAIIGTTLTTVSADAVAMGDLVWPIVVTIFGAVLLFKLFKRFGNKI
ncbi:MAG: capsid protein [Flavobacteriaceae bacterium]